MRFLHTGDWHIGKNLNGRSRLDEQEKVIAGILDIASREQVDCLLFAGDLYDSLAPAADAERLAFHFFSELTGRKIQAVIIGGNHDHPMRLHAVAPLLSRLKIEVRPKVAPASEGGLVSLAIRGEEARVACLPWVWAARLTRVEELMGPQEGLVISYQQRITRMLELLTQGFEDSTINILLSHIYIANAELSPGAERTVCTSQGYAIPAQVLPGAVSYAALGHLHRPQEIAAPCPVFYSGSPMQLDFGEKEQAKRVLIVDAKPGMKARIDSVPLTSGRELLDARGTLAELTAKADEFGDAFLRVTVKLDRPQLGIQDKVREILPNALQVSIELAQREAKGTEPGIAHDQLSPRDLFARYYAGERGGEAPEGLLSTFDELYEEASGASR